jgi:hypothetical protein
VDQAVSELVGRGRREGFPAVLPALTETARDGGAKPEAAWQACAAAVGILAWQDEFAAAADLAELVLARDAPRVKSLCDQRKPFGEVFIAAELHDQVPAAPRLARLIEAVPAKRVLHSWLSTRAKALGTRPLPRLLPNFAPWDDAPGSLEGEIGGRYFGRDYQGLAEPERRVLWEALRTTNRFDEAVALMEEVGGVPPVWVVCTWLAGGFAIRGDLDRAEELLIAAHGTWIPYDVWDVLPLDPVVQPALRPAATALVRERYLYPSGAALNVPPSKETTP